MARPQPAPPKPVYDPKDPINRYPRSLYSKTLLPNTRLVRNGQEEQALLDKGWQEEYVDPPPAARPLLTEVDIAVDQAQRSARASLEDLKEKHGEEVAALTTAHASLAKRHEAVQNAYSRLLITTEELTAKEHGHDQKVREQGTKLRELETAYAALQEVSRQLVAENEQLKKGSVGAVKPVLPVKEKEKVTAS